MVCIRNIRVDTPHKGVIDDNDNNNNNNNNSNNDNDNKKCSEKRNTSLTYIQSLSIVETPN